MWAPQELKLYFPQINYWSSTKYFEMDITKNFHALETRIVLYKILQFKSHAVQLVP